MILDDVYIIRLNYNRDEIRTKCRLMNFENQLISKLAINVVTAKEKYMVMCTTLKLYIDSIFFPIIFVHIFLEILLR